MGLAIPALIVLGAVEAEVGTKIDNPAVTDIVDQPLALAMRQGGEHQVAAVQQCRIPGLERRSG